MTRTIKAHGENLRRQFSAVAPVLRGYTASTATLVFSAACQFAWFILTARALGVVQFGSLVMIMAVTGVASALSGVGSGDTVIRRVARSVDEYPRMLGHALIVSAASGVVLTAICTVVLSVLVSASETWWINVLIMAGYSVIYVLLFRWMLFAEQVFIGFVRFRQANFINAGFSLVRLVTAALACLVFHVTSLGGWAMWLLGGHIFMSGICILMLAPLGRPVWHLDRKEIVLGFHYCTPTVVEALRTGVDRFVLGLVAPISVLGSYGTAYRMSEVSQIIVNALNRVVYPIFAKKKSEGVRAVLPLALRYLVVVLTLSSVTAFAVFAIAPWMPALLGATYRHVTFDLQVLSWLIIPMAARTVPYDILGAFDRHGMRALVYNSTLLVSAAGTGAAVYLYGVTGAFVAAYVVQLLLAWVLWLTLLGGAAGEQKQAAEVAMRRRSFDDSVA